MVILIAGSLSWLRKVNVDAVSGGLFREDLSRNDETICS